MIQAPAVRAIRPLFGGYALVAFACAWLVGIWLASLGPLEAIAPVWWLTGAALGLAGALGAALTQRRYGLSEEWRRGLRFALTAGALLLWLGLGAARAAASDPARDPLNAARFAIGGSVEAQGQIVSEPVEGAGYRILTVRVTSVTPSGEPAQPASGDIEATVYGPEAWFAPEYGDSVTLTGKLKPLNGVYAPGGVVARMPSARASIQARGGGFPPLATLYQWRQALAQGIERGLPEPEAALLIGIVLGLKTPVLRARLPLFITTGTIHLVVPAGLKVALLAEMAGRVTRRLGPWPQSIAALVAVSTYAALGGGGPAALRAAIMGALLALAPALGRTYNVYTALALAVFLMTGFQTSLIYDAGFQLTTLATFGLPLFTPVIQAALLRLAGPVRTWRVTGFIAESLAVTMAAQVATIPVLALTFHTVSLVAPLANLLTVPLLAPLLVLGAAFAVIAALGLTPLTLGLAWVLWPALAWANGAIAWSAALPLAALQVTQAPVALTPIYYLALLLAILALRPWLRAANAALAAARTGGHQRTTLGKRALVIALVVAALASAGASAPALAADTSAHLDFLDVGPGGAAILLREPGGFTALIDGGPSGPALESALAARLPFWRRSFDLAVLTDTRRGDARGLEDAATHYHISTVVDAGMLHPGTEYLAYLDAARRAGATRSQIRADDIIHLPNGATLTALAPPQTLYPPNEGDSQASDDLILRLDTPGLSALFLGAADAYALDALAGSGEPLSASVVEVAAQRGEPLDLSGPLGVVLRAAHPQVIIICDSPAPAPKGVKGIIADMGASDQQIALALGTQVYRVSSSGTIALSGGPQGWTMG